MVCKYFNWLLTAENWVENSLKLPSLSEQITTRFFFHFCPRILSNKIPLYLSELPQLNSIFTNTLVETTISWTWLDCITDYGRLLSINILFTNITLFLSFLSSQTNVHPWHKNSKFRTRTKPKCSIIYVPTILLISSWFQRIQKCQL